MVVDSKNSLRDKVRRIEVNDEHSAAIEAQIRSWSVFQKAEKVAFYMPMKDELSLEFLFASGKELFLPRYDAETKKYCMALVENKEQLISGKYGIVEPGANCREALKSEIELWFIPGMGFSRSGDRLGRGAGFYDRLLESEKGIKAGICCTERILNEIDRETHDVIMDFVLTDKEIIKIN